MVTTRFESGSVQKGIGTIVAAKFIISTTALSDVADFSFEMSADGGSNWETVSNDTRYEFTNTGTDLRYAIIGESGAQLKVKQTDGSDLPINVFANPSE